MVTNQSAQGEDGVFLLRNNAKQPDIVVITSRTDGKCHHAQLQRTPEGKYRNMSGVMFGSLFEAVSHYERSSEGDMGVLTRRINPL